MFSARTAGEPGRPDAGEFVRIGNDERAGPLGRGGGAIGAMRSACVWLCPTWEELIGFGGRPWGDIACTCLTGGALAAAGLAMPASSDANVVPSLAVVDL